MNQKGFISIILIVIIIIISGVVGYFALVKKSLPVTQRDPSKPSYCPTREQLEAFELGLEADGDNKTVITAIMEFTKVQSDQEFLNRKLPAGTMEVNFQGINTRGGGGGVVQNEVTFQQMVDRYNEAAAYHNPDSPKYGVLSFKMGATAKEILAAKHSMPKSYIVQVVRAQDIVREKALRAVGGKTIYPLGLVIECGL